MNRKEDTVYYDFQGSSGGLAHEHGETEGVY